MKKKKQEAEDRQQLAYDYALYSYNNNGKKPYRGKGPKGWKEELAKIIEANKKYEDEEPEEITLPQQKAETKSTHKYNTRSKKKKFVIEGEDPFGKIN